ncbi:MAG: HlyC/CorC family transporter [Planctomycetes bacterium]|nr:HlyC/CorC family transporter [Planctomycetota bacterium]
MILPQDIPIEEQGSYTLLAFYVSIALGFSFLCSVAEAVLLSMNAAFIEDKRENSPRFANLLYKLKMEKVDRSLAAILTLNTIAHTVGAIASGAEASKVFGNAWFGVFSAVMTLTILFLSEIVPKTIGAVYWKALSKPVAYFINILIFSMLPLVWLSELLTRLISKGKAESFTRDEMVAMARVGAKNGVIGPQEARIIENLFAFKSLYVKDIMTPRTVIGALPVDTSIDDAVKFIVEYPFSRIPIYQDNIDQLDGFILKFDVLLAHKEGKGAQKVSTLKRKLAIVPSTQVLSTLVTHLIQENNHMASVVNEYGGTEGIVTTEDIMETLVGFEIVDENDKVEDMQKLARSLWSKRARAMGIEI